jgi:hypothetical protein
MARLGHVAIDSTRVQANASRRRPETVQELRQRLAKTRRAIRRWQQQCAVAEGDEEPGTQVDPNYEQRLEQELEQTREKLDKRVKSGAPQQSRTDPDSGFLHQAGGFVLGYTVDLAVSEDHLIVAQGTRQAASDSESLLPMVDKAIEACGEWPAQASAGRAFFSVQNTVGLETRGVEGFLSDAHLSGKLQHHRGPLRMPGDSPEHCRMRARLRSPAGQIRYRRRQALVEPMIGVLKEQRGMRRV